MVYSKNDIILESAFFGDLTRINVATDMMCEHYLDLMDFSDDDVIEESVSSVLTTIGKMIKSTFERLKKFIRDKIEYIKRCSQMKKLKGIVTALDKQMLKDIPGDAKVEVPDIKAAYKYMDEIDKAVDILVKRVTTESRKISKFSNAEIERVEKLNQFIKTSTKKIDAIYEQILDTNKNTKKVSYSEYLKTIRDVLKINNRLLEMEKRLDVLGVQLNNGYLATQREIEKNVMELNALKSQGKYRKIHESANEPSENAETKKSILTGIKSAYQSVTGAIARFTHKHANVISTLLSVYSGLNVGNAVLNAGAAVTFDKSSKANLNNWTDTVRSMGFSEENINTVSDAANEAIRKGRNQYLKYSAQSAGLAVGAGAASRAIKKFGNKPLPEKYQKK